MAVTPMRGRAPANLVLLSFGVQRVRPTCTGENAVRGVMPPSIQQSRSLRLC